MSQYGAIWMEEALQIEIAIDFDQETQEFVLEWPELNIFLGAETREELWDDLVQDFFWLWEEYGKSEAQDLSQDAIELKQRLQDLVQEEGEVSQQRHERL